MEGISFFSKDIYISIPNSKNPKVKLAISKKLMAMHAFKIYNPFSFKAKMFKRCIHFFCTSIRSLFLKFYTTESYRNSEFIEFLNKKYNTNFTSSVYYATLKDKAVIQLQSKGKIYGYVKFPLNKIGLKNIINEIKAIELLNDKKVSNIKIKSLKFKGKPFFIMPELKGEISYINDSEVNEFISQYKKEDKFQLKNHPRVKEIELFFNSNRLTDELNILKSLIKSSTVYYYDVYEHGDFAPWNLIKTKEKLAAFDFEYFTEKGLEYLDLIKYHFQVGRLLKAKKGQELYDYLKSKIIISELKIMVSLFLLKEIMNSSLQKKNSEFEKRMLTLINE